MQACLAAKADLAARDAKGRSPLLLAVAGDGSPVVPERQKKIVVALLGAGADPTAADDKGYTALHYAAYHGAFDLVGLLLRAGAVLDARNLADETPLLLAVRGPLMDDDRKRCLDSICRPQANVRLLDSAGRSALHLLCAHKARLESPAVADETILSIAQMLVERGADLKSEDARGNTPLSNAIREGHEQTSLWLLSKGAFASPPVLAAYSGLHLAVERLQPSLVDALLRAGLDINRATSVKQQAENMPYFFPKGSTPLDIALISEHEQKDPQAKAAYKSMAASLKGRGAISKTFQEYVEGFKSMKGGGAPPSSKTGVRR